MLLRRPATLGLCCVLALASHGLSHARGISAARDARAPIEAAVLERAQVPGGQGHTGIEPAGPQYRRGTQTLSYGFYEMIEGEPFAVRDETWTFDHGDAAARGLAIEGPERRATHKRIPAHHERRLEREQPRSVAPIPADRARPGSAYYENEATDAGWASAGSDTATPGASGYHSPPLTYTGDGNVALSFDYFNRTEADFDFTRVRLLLERRHRCRPPDVHRHAGKPGSSSYPTHNRTITSPPVRRRDGVPDRVRDDLGRVLRRRRRIQQHDPRSLRRRRHLADRQYRGGRPALGLRVRRPRIRRDPVRPIGDLFGIEDVSTYGIECDDLSGFVAEMHNDESLSPGRTVRIHLLAGAGHLGPLDPDSVYVEHRPLRAPTAGRWSLLPHRLGVLPIHVPGGSPWSDRVGGTQPGSSSATTLTCGPGGRRRRMGRPERSRPTPSASGSSTNSFRIRSVSGSRRARSNPATGTPLPSSTTSPSSCRRAFRDRLHRGERLRGHRGRLPAGRHGLDRSIRAAPTGSDRISTADQDRRWKLHLRVPGAGSYEVSLLGKTHWEPDLSGRGRSQL